MPEKRRAKTLHGITCIAILLALLAVMLVSGCRGTGTSGPASNRQAASSAAPQNEPRFRFIVCGDPQNNYQVFNKILQAAKNVDFLIIAGDLTGSGTRTEFANFLNAMKNSGVRYYCVPGNHDVATSPVGENYSSFLGAPYGSFDHLNSHFVLIDNSTPALGFYESEREWVKNDLKTAGSRGFDHIFAVCHVPPRCPYSGHPGPSEAAGIDANDFLVPVLSRGGVEELFCGHIHIFKQSREDGMLVKITGGAGAPLHMGEENGGYYHYVLVEIEGKQRKREVIKV